MRKTLALLILTASLALAQTGKTVTVCWQSNAGQPDAGPRTCTALDPGTVTLVTMDLRAQPAQYVVVQPIPDYQIQAMQTHVTNQSYNMQQADGSLRLTQRYSSIQTLLMQFLVRNVIVPSLQLYPPDGENANKTNARAVMMDIAAGTRVSIVQ